MTVLKQALSVFRKSSPWHAWRTANFPNEVVPFFREEAYINGQWVTWKGPQVDVIDPATEEVIGQIPNMGAEETRQAIDAAHAAQKGWAAKPAAERATVLRKMHALMLEHQETLAHILTAECGKPLAEARGEIVYAASFFEWFAEEAKRTYGDIIPGKATNHRLMTVRQPVGVCALITPWNFPAAMITRKLGPAMAAGCTSVIKPAAETPFSALALAEIAEMAGAPPGVVNIVTCSKEDSAVIGDELCKNSLVRKLSFTGSTAVGKHLYKQCANTVKKVSLELGGNAPFIVFDDADIDAAVEGAIVCKFRNCGQTCVCANRMFIQEGVYAEFVQKLVNKVEKMTIGHGFQEGTHIGPMIDTGGVLKVADLVKDAVSKGAKIEVGSGESDGHFVTPTVLSGVTNEMRTSQEEIFGPVAPCITFKDEAEVIAMANATNAGLASYFFSRDIGRVWRVAEALEYGMVAVNTGALSNEVSPFGGVKESGLGREGSKYGLDEYTEIKYICMAGM